MKSNPKSDFAIGRIGYILLNQSKIDESISKLSESIKLNENVSLYHLWFENKIKKKKEKKTKIQILDLQNQSIIFIIK